MEYKNLHSQNQYFENQNCNFTYLENNEESKFFPSIKKFCIDLMNIIWHLQYLKENGEILKN